MTVRQLYLNTYTCIERQPKEGIIWSAPLTLYYWKWQNKGFAVASSNAGCPQLIEMDIV
ncbi:MAG: hypothetical protein ACR5LD_01810 [Symbiopectobacterium sp.]